MKDGIETFAGSPIAELVLLPIHFMVKGEKWAFVGTVRLILV